jgi:Fis family transcriptional regulator
VEGNQTHAATILGINRGTLRKKLKEYGLVG